MKNSAQSFQRLIQDVLKDIPNIFVYLDDILVFSKDKTSHLKTVEEVLRRLSDAGLTLALSKCQFGLQELEYLGFLVNSEGIRPVDKKISAIITSQPQKNKNNCKRSWEPYITIWPPCHPWSHWMGI